MDKDLLNKLKMNSRDEVVSFLKSLWSENAQPCPLCGGKLDFLHKKAKNIVNACMQEKSKNPVEIFYNIAHNEFVRIHGPEHHIFY